MRTVKRLSFGTPTGTGNQLVTGIGFRPDVLLFQSSRQTVIDTIESNSHVMFGAAAVNDMPNPTEIPGLSFWVKADAEDYVDGQLVGVSPNVLSDRTGGTKYGYVNTEGVAPTFRTNIFNGLPVLDFDGTSDEMKANDTDTVFATAACSTFIVLKSDSSSTGRDLLQVPDDRSGLNASGSGNAQWKFKRTSDGTSLNINAGSWVSAPTLLEMICTYTGTKTSYRNGVQVATDATSCLQPATNDFDIARSGVNFFDGQIAELIVYNTALSTADRQRIEQYIFKKYGIGSDNSVSGISQYTQTSFEQNNTGGNTQTARQNVRGSCIAFLDNTGSANGGLASLVSVNNDGFTLNWSTAPAGAYLVDVIAIGGVEARCAMQRVDMTSLGAQTLPTDLEADGGILMGGSAFDITSVSSGAQLNLGAFTDTLDQCSIWTSTQDNAATTNVAIGMRADCVHMTGDTGGVQGRFSVTDIDDVGVAIRIDDAHGVTNFISLLVMSNVGMSLDSLSVPLQEEELLLGSFRPEAVLAFSLLPTTALPVSTNTQNARILLAMADDNGESHVWAGSEDNVGTENTQRIQAYGGFLGSYTLASGSATREYLASVTDYDANTVKLSPTEVLIASAIPYFLIGFGRKAQFSALDVTVPSEVFQ